MAEKQKILIVDDKKENLIALRHVLSVMDVELVEATSGNQALAATFDHQFAVAILDVQMPGMSGYELAEHLRGDEKTKKIPILFLTAHHGDEQDIFKGYEAGGIDYLTKPYPPEVLRGKLKIFLEIDRYRRELENAWSIAEKTSLAKSEFLANMSHELRTPLNSVIGFSEVLQDQLFGQINDKQQEYVKNILTSGRHLLSLINDILDLSKVESGKMVLDLSAFSLRETLDASLMMLREKALKGGIDLRSELAELDEVKIVADQRKLKQILYNLLSNAVKFTPAGGTVDVSAVQDGDFIEITVADSGIGLRQEDIPKLFRAFTQLESVYTKEYEGTGLGLALTRHLVELHGGRIWVKSEFGTGSRFIFTIPVRMM